MVKGKIKEQKGIEHYMQLTYSILLHEVEDEGEKFWIAEVPELPGCRSHGSTVEEAVKSIEEAKKDWISDSLKKGEGVPTPVERERYSGRMLVRMSRSLHRSLALIADAEKLSLNQLIVTMLAKEAGRLNILNRVEDKVDNLLDKIDHVLEEEGVRIPSLVSLNAMMQAIERGQDIIIDTEHALEGFSIAGNMGAVASATTSLLEDIWKYEPIFRYPRQQRAVYSASIVAEENKVKNEQK